VAKNTAVNSIGQCNIDMKVLISGGLFNEAHVYKKRKNFVFDSWKTVLGLVVSLIL